MRMFLFGFLSLVVMSLSVVPAYADNADVETSDGLIAWLVTQDVGATLADRVDRVFAYQLGGAPETVVNPLLNDIEFLLEQNASVPVDVLAKAIVVLDLGSRPLVLSTNNRNLLAELRASVSNPPAVKGEYDAIPGKELTVQAWGVLAEMRMGAKPRDEVNYLLSRRCPGGWYVANPTPQGCEQPIDLVDQAMVLTALLAAANRGIAPSNAPRGLTTWLAQEVGATKASTTVSTSAWLTWPLNSLGERSLASSLRLQVRSLQLTSKTAIDPKHVGALGGQTQAVASDATKQRLAPASSVSIAGVQALSTADITTMSYRARPALRSLAKPMTSAVGPMEAKPGERVSFFVQGFTSGEDVTLRISGVRGTVAKAQVKKDGSAVLSFTASARNAVGQKLEFRDGQGLQAETLVSIVRPLASKVDSSSAGSSSSNALDSSLDEREVFALPLWLALGLGGLLVLVLFFGVWLLREQPQRH